MPPDVLLPPPQPLPDPRPFQAIASALEVVLTTALSFAFFSTPLDVFTVMSAATVKWLRAVPPRVVDRDVRVVVWLTEVPLRRSCYCFYRSAQVWRSIPGQLCPKKGNTCSCLSILPPTRSF